ncbi:MAG: Fe-S cluster assembly scaffold IscU [Deltaproteobacteria bacterium]|nr:Fe-S cluster assembly scaffold IscU [Deltaproteobacteria bacterium]
MAYSDKVIEHYERPRNVGSFDKADPSVGTGLVGAPACGDVMKLQLRINDAGVIEDAKFKTFGCGSAIASSSLVTEWVKGKSIDDAGKIRNRDIAEELSLPPVKIHCSVLAEDAVKAAIFDYRLKKGLLSDDDVLASVGHVRPAGAEDVELSPEDIGVFTEEAKAEKLLDYHRAHGRVVDADLTRVTGARAAADQVRARYRLTLKEVA